MLQDLAALTPPLIMCTAFILGVAWFLRREIGPVKPATSDDASPGDTVSVGANSSDDDHAGTSDTGLGSGNPAADEDGPAGARER